jgi:ribosome-binding protein aMBF1 (putative translation factor)
MKPPSHSSGTRAITSGLGGRIRFERQRWGWTCEQLAAQLGWPADGLARIELGETVPSQYELGRIAAALCVTVEHLTSEPDATGFTKPGVG